MRYFYSLIFTLFLFYGSSQTYYPTGTDSTTYSVACFNLSSGAHSTWIEQFTFRGDTIINGKLYIKVYYSDDNNIDTSYDVNSSMFNYKYLFCSKRYCKTSIYG